MPPKKEHFARFNPQEFTCTLCGAREYSGHNPLDAKGRHPDIADCVAYLLEKIESLESRCYYLENPNGDY